MTNNNKSAPMNTNAASYNNANSNNAKQNNTNPIEVDAKIYLQHGVTLQAKIICKASDAKRDDFNITTCGELVFTTTMTGYQETITDPSFAEQIIVMTYPLIGNYGTNEIWNQRDKINAKGIVVSHLCENDADSNFNSTGNFFNFVGDHSDGNANSDSSQSQCSYIITVKDTRDLVSLIRESDYLKCIVSTNLNLTPQEQEQLYLQINPNKAEEISTSVVTKHIGTGNKARKDDSNNNANGEVNGDSIAVIDFGLKYGIIDQLKPYFKTIFTVPHNYTVEQILALNVGCVLFSNGPGDPAELHDAIANVKTFFGKIKIYGICLGHQLLGLALGCKTNKMKFGHRGANHAVINLNTKQVIVTSQNHGYEIEKEGLPNNVKITHQNVQDESVEGIECEERNIKCVQFHPEGNPGPEDTNKIFEDWFGSSPMHDSPLVENNTDTTNIKNVLVIGSGAIVIGQAAEFDYSGTQACMALKEEGLWTALINNNPATIMTDAETADKVYIASITTDEIEKIIVRDKIDSILATCGGQTALNMAIKLHDEGILKKHNVKLIGTNIATIKEAEDRNLFKSLMEKISEPICKGEIINSLDAAINFANKTGYPLIIRPSLTLGGSGGGIAHNQTELEHFVIKGLSLSPIKEVLLEKSIYGWKEVEYEIIRDANNTCISICNMENLDPVGIHTGDSIVVAPSQTLSDKDYQMLRSSAIKIVRALNVQGACNVQFGLNPNSKEYIVIEVNPRVSRSSALASKATAYPIAKIAAKIAIGKHLHQITNPISNTTAAMEPALDYIVAKVPCFPFDKFPNASQALTTQMKATGEWMGIGLNFAEAFLKCISVDEINKESEEMHNITTDDLMDAIKNATHKRIFQVIECLKRAINNGESSLNNTIADIEKSTYINKWFVYQLLQVAKICNQKQLINNASNNINNNANGSANIVNKNNNAINEDVHPLCSNPKLFFKRIDGCSGEFEAQTTYVYSTYHANSHNISPLPAKKGKMLILGSGAIKIGQGIEFDYASVHAVKALQKHGYTTIMINNNPETISTDFNIADRLYFEPIEINNILQIAEFEQIDGVFVQFGGQTALNLIHQLDQHNIKIFGTQSKNIDITEDRNQFNKLLHSMGIIQPKCISTTLSDADLHIDKVEFPVIARPSYVIGGSKMQIIQNKDALLSYIEMLKSETSEDTEIFVDEFISGREFEIDLVCDGENVFIPLIAEHIEPSGIHSGDSSVMYPHKNATDEEVEIMNNYANILAKKLHVQGLMNIQFVAKGGKIYVIEVNLRSSRTVPVINKVCDINMVHLAIDAILNANKHKSASELIENPFKTPQFNVRPAVKKAVFSNEKITQEKIPLGPEMRATGETLEFEDA